ncbi:MAG: class I SAM-dependent methyltransferase [Anaerolineaceae bacterium]
MDKATQQALIALNLEFYDSCAQSFSATRQKVQPGVRKLLERILSDATLLDLGCGNGNFARKLAAQGFTGHYLGLDGSAAFIQEAQALLSSVSSRAVFTFHQADLTTPDWASGLSSASFDVITAFAVLHHLPGEDLPRQIFQQAWDLLKPTGHFFLSVWQVQNSPRLCSHSLPWSSIEIDSHELSANDLLMDWRGDAANSHTAMRYVHLFSPLELQNLGTSSGLVMEDEFFSDGKQGDLALYEGWSKAQ